MDGVIIDSSPIHYENWNSIFEEKFGITIPKEEFGMQFGMNGNHFTEYFLKKYNLNVDVKDIKPLIIERFNKLKSKINLKSGLMDVLKELHHKYKIALASGAPREFMNDSINRFNLRDYFDFIISGDDVKIAKPNPKIFLKVANALYCNPSECIVVEDSILGIKASKSAGMYTVAVACSSLHLETISRTGNPIGPTLDPIACPREFLPPLSASETRVR